MECLGEFEVITKVHDKSFSLRIFVVNAKTDNLLSREASTRMGLVKRIDAVVLPFGALDDKPVDCPPIKILLKDNSQP